MHILTFAAYNMVSQCYSYVFLFVVVISNALSNPDFVASKDLMVVICLINLGCERVCASLN
jgi:hypothetical protein